MSNFYKSSQWVNKRKRILRRDEYLCRECKRYGKNTEATLIHHVYPFLVRPELRLTSWNLLSLCKTCHEKMHDRTTDELTDLGIQWVDRVERNRVNEV
ncbi:HNH endonuclease [Niallia sp. RD1]|uniref:HNH endonuclease n=1 Tax=Niallia sp. RD1 TaxID=2962858 RepID=UPI0020C1A266|nr:HNH endonuclease [Niallia sp. RD1]UTI42112.1 HNH endonuclease [Niallia sp. RD1]